MDRRAVHEQFALHISFNGCFNRLCDRFVIAHADEDDV